MLMSYLVQILLPLNDNTGNIFNREKFWEVENYLIDKFGGVTIFSHSPAEGLWSDPTGEVDHDVMVIFEVMSTVLNRTWWKEFRKILEAKFKQEEIVIRATGYEKL